VGAQGDKKSGERPQAGGLFPEDRRRTKPSPSEYRAVKTPENGRKGLRAAILQLLLRSNIQAAVTDAKTVQTGKGKRQLVYPEGWPDITASIPVTGRAWAIEIKTEDGELRPAQEEKLLELVAAGWLVTLARSVDDVNGEIKRQFQLLWEQHREAFKKYLATLRTIRSDAAQKSVERETRKRARERQTPSALS
jgi:hypothetical protein